MAIEYYLDFSLFSMEKLKYKLTHFPLIPSHKILLDEIDARFEILANNGIINLEQLSSTLKNKDHLASFSQKTGIPEKYLEILVRHIGIYRPEPNLINQFPGIDPLHQQKLAALGIKNSKQLLEQAHTSVLRQALSDKSGIPVDCILEYARLADLSRAGYVGPIFARLLYDAGAVSIRSLSAFDAQDLFDLVMQVNQDKSYTKGSFQAKDLAWSIAIARELPIILEE
jgi:hypothetical protein